MWGKVKTQICRLYRPKWLMHDSWISHPALSSLAAEEKMDTIVSCYLFWGKRKRVSGAFPRAEQKTNIIMEKWALRGVMDRVLDVPEGKRTEPLPRHCRRWQRVDHIASRGTHLSPVYNATLNMSLYDQLQCFKALNCGHHLSIGDSPTYVLPTADSHPIASHTSPLGL